MPNPRPVDTDRARALVRRWQARAAVLRRLPTSTHRRAAAAYDTCARELAALLPQEDQ